MAITINGVDYEQEDLEPGVANSIEFEDKNLNKLYFMFNNEIESFLNGNIDNNIIKKFKIAAKIAELNTKSR